MGSESGQTINILELRRALEAGKGDTLFDDIVDAAVARDARGMDPRFEEGRDSLNAVKNGNTVAARIQLRVLFEVARRHPEYAAELLEGMSHLQHLKRRLRIDPVPSPADDSDTGLLKQADEAGSEVGA
ncbi:MAG: hypothetical protein RLZZ416_190 [Candidatus Parcubacteria bacterium]|jgi:hypothetical protein